MRKAVSFATASILTALSLAAASAWHRRVALPYGEEGRFFDEAAGVTYTDSAVPLLGLLTLSLVAAAVAAMIWSWRTWRR